MRVAFSADQFPYIGIFMGVMLLPVVNSSGMK